MRRRKFLGAAGLTIIAAADMPAARSAGGAAGAAYVPPTQPVGAEGRFTLVRDWKFGRGPQANIHNMAELAKEFRFRYIYNGGWMDGLPSYWSHHRDYPEGDPRSLHVFGDDALVLKGRIPPGGGLRPGGIESGMLRALLPVIPGAMMIEMRARLPRGLGVWPAFWLNPGVEQPDGKISATPWPPEIDVFEFFVWQGRTQPRLLTAHVQTAGHPERYGNPYVIYSKLVQGVYDPGIDFSADFHVFGMNWLPDTPTWLVDGERIQQMHYTWPAPPAHILVTNQIGMALRGTDMTGMKMNEADWDYTIDWLRVWRRL